MLQRLSWCQPGTPRGCHTSCLAKVWGSCQRGQVHHPHSVTGPLRFPHLGEMAYGLFGLRGGREQRQPCSCVSFHHSWCGFISLGTHITFYVEVTKTSQASESKLSWDSVPELSDCLTVGPCGGKHFNPSRVSSASSAK